MKRRLIILSVLFLALFVVCFYYPVKNQNMHMALMVQLGFFIHYLVKPADKKMTNRDIVTGKEESGIMSGEEQKQPAAKNTEIEQYK